MTQSMPAVASPGGSEERASAMLRRCTSEAHAATEGTAISRALAAAELGRADYRRVLEVHRVLSDNVRPAPGAETWPGWARSGFAQQRRCLEADLAMLGQPESPAPAFRARLEEAQRRTAQAGRGEAERSGWVYVLAGSALGARLLLPRLEVALGARTPLTFYRWQAREGIAHFRQVRAWLDAQLGDPGRRSGALAGARSAFDTVRALFEACPPAVA